MENQTTYRIRTKLGETNPINIPVSLLQEYNSFEILSLKINTDETYQSYTSTDGIVVGRVSTANNGLGIPNVRVSIFVPKGTYNQTDEEAVLYPFSSPTDKDGDRVRYNLLPSESDVDCYQVVGTMPTKRKILDNETVCEVFDKYYKYTTVTNEAGDFMLTNIPVGKQRIHIDADLSDIGPFLSQRPYDMIENLGYDKNKFDSTRQFKTSNDLDSLVQIISQTKSLYVYPYWGDVTENSADMKITRTDLSLNYEFKTSAIFMGSIITDKQSNSIRQNCTATEDSGKMSDMITGTGRIEMIRKTVDDKVEQFRINGDRLINDNGVWCYMIPMNLDYVCTDEYGNIVPTDDPNKGVATRAKVRFRITLDQMESDEDAHKRCSYLVPNNPKISDENFLKENNADYSFGSDTWDESYVDLFWNKVYTVKSFVPRIQKTVRATNRKHTGVKMVNHYGDNNPFPYNGLTIRLSFTYRLLCVIIKVIITTIEVINSMFSIISAFPCWLAYKTWIFKYIFRPVMMFVPSFCIKLSTDFCDDGINKNVYYPGCGKPSFASCIWDEKVRKNCEKEQAALAAKGQESAICTNETENLITCVENQLAQQNDVTSFNFYNDWVNGCLYMPLWYRHIRPKKAFFFGLFKRKAKDQWCSSDYIYDRLKVANFCAHRNTKKVKVTNYNGEEVEYKITKKSDNCGDDCHENISYVGLSNGIIINRESLYGNKIWYYKAVEVSSAKTNIAAEYLNYDNQPMVSKTLYATDIVLLGSMNDCDLNGVPKFFNYLKGTTYNMPTDILFSDTEIVYGYENGNLVTTDSHKTSVASGCDWGNQNEYGYYDGGLFYSIGCSTAGIDVDTPSCVNLRRICELGVGQDEMQYIENINTNINSENDQLDMQNLDYYLRPDGFISYDDIIDFNYRSMFATMNGNRLKTKINNSNGVREYDFRHLYIDNFDGSLYEFMRSEQNERPKANYKYNYKLESTSNDYLTFRFGDRPYFYDGESLVEGGTYQGNGNTLPKYENSFYFYFGLKEGKTAIDVFNDKYNAQCATKVVQEDTIDYKKKSNSWCNVDSDADNTYDHSTFDGYITFNLEDVSLPCTMMFNSKNNSAVSYTVTKLNDPYDVNVSDEKICFYGDNGIGVEDKKNVEGFQKYSLIYENGGLTLGEGAEKCQMLNNGEYVLYITDGEGNQLSYDINLNGKYLEFDDIERSLGQPNNVLSAYYKPIDGNPYRSVAISPETNEISVTIGSDNIPNVSRNDKEMDNVVNEDVIAGEYVKLNGTICVYNVYCDNSPLTNFIIEVEPYSKDVEGNYIDSDFWKNSEATKETWYNPKLMIIGDTVNECKTVTNKDGKVYVEAYETNPIYFTFYKDEDKSINCYIIKCPKGGVDYRVTVTQLCNDEKGYYKSYNYYEKKITVNEPTPYKLYINSVDYDIIKNFNTGYEIYEQSGCQWLNGDSDGPLPFNDFGDNDDSSKYEKIRGWLDISNVNNEYYDWSVNEELYGTGDLNDEKGINGEYEIINQYNELLENEPNEENFDDINDYVAKYEEWEKNTRTLSEEIMYLNNRLQFIDTMKDAFWIQSEDSDKSIAYSVKTDDTPYNIWTVYNEEETSSVNEDYNETKSEPNNGYRNGWRCKGESTNSITGIKIPTITSYDSKDFGISNDVYRQENMKKTYDVDNKTTCFAQDNIAENSKDKGSISIKPPYLVACVNNEGITKPENLKKGEFFARTTNTYGIETYEFGNVAGNNGYLRRNNYGFFSFHLIDKIFAPNIVCWAYMNNMPYYLPWLDYNTKATDKNRIGYNLTVRGILSGNINNGITSSVDEYGCVDDFEKTEIFSQETPIKTYKNDSEDSIPTRRCILYNREIVDDESLVYKNYKFTNGVFDANGNVYKNQYRLVPNGLGELNFSDKDGNNIITKDLYGAMQIKVLPTTLNEDAFTTIETEIGDISTGTGENGDKSLTLRVSCSNGDSDNAIKYYIFRASQKQTINSAIDENVKACWYPLNAFECKTVEMTHTYYLDCKCTDDDETKWVWDGSTDRAPQMFSKNTLESIFKDTSKSKNDLVDNTVSSTITYEDAESETQIISTKGYGNTGVFTDLKHFPYFVVAVTEDGCRTISPVYDFQNIYYVAGVYWNSKEGPYYLRIALVYVLQDKETGGHDVDTYENYGVPSIRKAVEYSKTPRNYYLTQHDFTVNYKVAIGADTVTEDGFVYKKDSDKFIDNKDGINDTQNVGYFYSEKNGEYKYTLYSITGGTFEKTGEASEGTGMADGNYCYKIYQSDKDKDGKPKVKYQLITISKNGTLTKGRQSNNKPSDVTEIELWGKYYINYKEDDGTDKYVTFTYSNYTTSVTDYNPRVPYFIKPIDREITQREFQDFNNAFNDGGVSEIENLTKVYVTDVTGLKHKCSLYDVIGFTGAEISPWRNYIKMPE